MRRCASLCSTTPSECENKWASGIERPYGAYFLGQPEVKADSATSILARGVKRRLHGGLPPECNSPRRDGMAARLGSIPMDAEQPNQPVTWFKRITIPNTWQLLEESDADVAVDVDCCGDSGSISKLSSRSPGVSAFGSNRPVHRLASRVAYQPLPALPEQDKSCSGPTKTISAAPAKQQDESSSLPVAITPRMPKAGSGLSEQQASTEMAFRLNHARQTVAFVQRQAASFSRLNKVKLGVWDALQQLKCLDEHRVHTCRAADQPLMPPFDHAVQTAELCRLAYPQHDWLHLVGLIHSLGKLMALPSFGAQPEWAVFSESFPVGCRFSSSIPCPQFFSVNPDRRSRLYSSPTGMYKPGCGLSAVYMSWTAHEYLYLILIKNKTVLPPVARFVLRHCNFLALMRPGNAYSELLSGTDFAMMPWLRKFQVIQQAPHQEVKGCLEGPELRQYYERLIIKYIPSGELQF
ncbi:hypothetical protein ABBQ38_010160 [Trebouxia sp. C0009 RCD-2024]